MAGFAQVAWFVWAAFLGGILIGPCHARWAPLPSPTSSDLNAVCLLPDGSAWAVGDGGTILATPDGGETWEMQAAPITIRFLSVDFVTPSTGWASGAGADAVRTEDGGQTWKKVTVVHDDLGLGPPDAVAPVQATGNSTAWTLARWGDAAFLYHTDDAGATWSTVRYTDHGYNSPNTVFGIAFTSDEEGWLIAARITGPPQAYIPVFMHTTDGGANWRVLDGYATPLNQPGTPDWRVAVGTAAPSNILAHVYDPARSTGRAFHVLEDATGLWRQVAIPVDAPVASASFPAAARAWLVGSDTFQSIDYAHTFRRAQNPEGMSLAASFPPVPDGAVARGLGVGPGGRIFRWEPDPAGDVNGDGLVDLSDAILAMALAAAGDAGTTPGHAPTDALSRRMADIDPAPDGDGLLTPADAAAILRKAGGQGK